MGFCKSEMNLVLDRSTGATGFSKKACAAISVRAASGLRRRDPKCPESISGIIE
jgi:hypothetical protein